MREWLVKFFTNDEMIIDFALKMIIFIKKIKKHGDCVGDKRDNGPRAYQAKQSFKKVYVFQKKTLRFT